MVQLPPPLLFPCTKIIPSSSLRQIHSLSIFALWHWQSHGRKAEESSPEDSESLPLGHFLSNRHLPERHTLCSCLHIHVQILPMSHSLREKNNYADFEKSFQVIPLEEVPNPALENPFKQQRCSRCVGSGWFDGDTCYPQIPFLLAFHCKTRCTREQMDFCFFPSSTLFPAATRQGMQGLNPHHGQQNAKKVTVTTCPKFQSRARAKVGLNDTVEYCSVETAKGALTDHFPGLAAKHCTLKVLLALHGH